ncbi:MAG: polysaccharide deacetylase family protein, partial [Treponema sp.]|nr:polysaccharide deacetylase family protein [Treponema sp.]
MRDLQKNAPKALKAGRLAAAILLLVLPALGILFSCESLDRSKKMLGLPDKFVVFTFDDGPNPQGDTTARLLDVLKKYQIQ